MRGFLSIIFILIVVLMAYPFVFVDEGAGDKLTGLPWQIERLDEGATRVFGITPGGSTLNEAMQSLGDDYQFGVISSDRGQSLEMYFGHYRVGLMSAKIVLLADATQQQVEGWLERAIHVEHMETGRAKRFTLSADDQAAALSSVVRLISFVPAVNLDDEIIRKRFGDPAEVVEHAGVMHYLYPELGLEIALDQQGKEVLQYIAPQEFASLTALLRQPLQP